MDRITRRDDRDGEVKMKLWVDVLCRNEKGDVPWWYLHVRRINFESIWRSSYAKGTMLEFLEISLTNISWFSKLYKYARVVTIIEITFIRGKLRPLHFSSNSGLPVFTVCSDTLGNSYRYKFLSNNNVFYCSSR